LEFRIATTIPDKNAKIIVYCGTDRRSPLATKTLNDLGYINAVNMVGCLRAWEEAGYPIRK
jgi:rhodanese-related sulfurtransferase